jgi:SHS2 domain-containing protein
MEIAFAQAATAMMAVMTDVEAIRGSQSVEFACQESDTELLLLAWLNAVLYEMDTRRMLFGRFEVRIVGDQLAAKAWGEPIDSKRHEFLVEVKAATAAELKVGKDGHGKWFAQCIVDV